MTTVARGVSPPRVTGRPALTTRALPPILAAMQPDPELVEHYRQAIAARPKGERGGYALGYLVSSIRSAAEDHSRNCVACPICDHLRAMLSFALAYELNEAPPDLLRRIHGMGGE